MKIHIIYIGDRKTKFLEEAVLEYEGRMVRDFEITYSNIGHKGKEAESESVLSNVSQNDFLVLMDETGKILSSTEFTDLIEGVKNDSFKRLVFVIGGAYGVDDKVKSRADRIVSFGKMIFPHELARVMLLEQLYRSTQINKGTGYHHA